MSETPRTWTMAIAWGRWRAVRGPRPTPTEVTGDIRVEVYEASSVDAERERMLGLLRRWAGYDEPGAVRTETARLLREHGRLGRA